MRKLIFTLVGAMLLGVAASANPYGYGYANSALVVKTTDGSPVSVKLDYNWFAPSSVIRTGNMLPGNHTLQIVRHQGYHYGYQTCQMHQVVVYNSTIHIKPNSQVVASIDHRNAVCVSAKTLPGRSYGNGYNNGGYSNGNNGGYGSGHGSNHNTGGYGGYVNNGGGNFNQVKYTVQNASFDKDKLQIAQQYIASNGVTAQQVLELMNLLSFESNKLNLAKFAYEHTFDKQNYYLVNNGFSFSSSTRELNKHISYY